MNAPALQRSDLSALDPAFPFFIGIDSDGCVFDSMELKHKECFCPAFVNQFGLQSVGRFARETWDFVNLYSKSRGLNRFHAARCALALLNERPEVRQQLGAPIDVTDLETWLSSETQLSGAVLERYILDQGDALADDSILHACLRWSNDVMEAVKKIVHDLPPISEAVEALKVIHSQADCVVVSQTPSADLIREWQEHDIDRFARLIAGQEQGTKQEHLALAAGSKYPQDQVLMIGDAPGDHQAAEANGFLFFPIVPGRERESWRELLETGLDHFFHKTYAGAYQEGRLELFHQSLPEQPPWLG